MKPVVLAPNQFPHFYRGGRRIEELRGLPPRGDDMPEDWIASTTTRFGDPQLGLSTLPDGRLLRDAIAADPITWLGSDHLAAFGGELDLLVKLLDAGQRLVVHAHPDRRFARTHLGCSHGKTEAWIVVDTADGDSTVYLGFREAVPANVVRRWVDDQDTDAMLGSLNAVPVTRGDAILVPAGLPHAIGAGVLIVEVQEPTDFSVVLEWKGFDLDGPTDGHLGLGYDMALQCLDRTTWSAEHVERLRGPADDRSSRVRLLSPAADPFFRAERIRDGADLESSVAVLVVTNGAGKLQMQDGDDLTLRRGETIVVPHAAGPSRVVGDIEIIRCLPPDPTAADAADRPRI